MRLTEEQRLLRDTARDVAQNLLAPHAAEWDREARFPREALTELGKCWVLNGTKQFITSGSNADVALVFAVTDPAAGRRGISAFIVPTDSPGYRVASLEKKLGQRASDTAQLVFEDLELTPDLMLGA